MCSHMTRDSDGVLLEIVGSGGWRYVSNADTLMSLCSWDFPAICRPHFSRSFSARGTGSCPQAETTERTMPSAGHHMSLIQVRSA